MKKRLFLLVLVTTLLTACTTGLGEEVDLEAPELTITSPAKLSYQHLEFDITGTCSDNKGVTEVVISNKENGKVYGNATIDGNNWIFHVKLSKEEEGEITFQCTANDAFKNSSTKSSRTITLLVDEHAPEGLSWYVDRGNSIQTPLKEKEFLENLDLNFSVNKDYPQNEQFTLYGNFYDAMGIDNITVKLWDDDCNPGSPVLTKTVSSNKNAEPSIMIPEGKSIYSPSFTFSHDDFPPLLRSGKHYLRVTYVARDNDTPDSYNETDEEQGEGNTGLYIFWYPESDKPGIQQTQVENNKLSASVGSAIPIDFFDDDGLKEIKWALVKSSSVNPSTYNYINIPDEPAETRTFSNSETRDVPVQINAPEKPGQMYLITWAKDINNKVNTRVIPTEITDAQKPLLFVESPSENTIPNMKLNSTDTFTISGYSLDSKGSSYIAILYNSREEGSQEEAQALIDSNLAVLKSNKKIVSNGSSIWYYEFADKDPENGWVNQPFSFDMNILTDFKNESGVSTAKDRKFFEIILMDTDNNSIYKPFILNGDSTKPTIEISNPTRELEVHDFTQKDLLIKFKGVKATDLGMNEDAYKVKTKIGDEEYIYNKNSNPRLTVSGGYATVTIPKETLKTWSTVESQPTFTFYSTDILGNGGDGEGQRSIILSERPTITEITVDKNSGTYKKGDVLKFKVSFSKQVKVTGIPKLKLKYSAVDTDPKYATYSEGSGSNSLLFTFTVPENALSNAIICEGLDVLSENTFASGIRIQATELGEGDVYTAVASNKILEGKTIKLDGKLPTINKITVQGPNGIQYCTKDKIITAIVEMSEDVLISGSPVLNLKSNGTTLPFTFQKMNGNEIIFTHTVSAADAEGVISTNKKTSFSTTDAKYITDKAGNVFILPATGSDTVSSINIDYTAPANAPSTNFDLDSYNTSQTITLSDYEENAKAYYSKDGGVSWALYNPENKETIGNGTYRIVTRQEDAAGNMSNNSAVKTVIINSNFPAISAFTINVGDGYYKAGSKISCSLDFEEAVVVNNATDIKMTLADSKNADITKIVNVIKPAVAETTSVKFEFTVEAGESFDGVVIKEITFVSTFKDVYGNSPAFTSTPYSLTPTNCSFLNATDGGKRTGIIIDGVNPNIATYVPAMSGTISGISSETDNSKFKITLTFNENVEKEVGNIILQRKAGWAIPPVLEYDKFMTYYNKMTLVNKKIVVRSDANEKEILHGKTGISVGPYRKITQGLKVSNGKYIPDEATKFVLAYELGLYDGQTSLNDGTEAGTFIAKVSDIRSAFESVDYHRHYVDVASDFVTISKNVVTITFAEAIEDGQEWDLIIPPTAFRDNAENFYKGMNLNLLKAEEITKQGITTAQQTDSDKYSVWTNNVAAPVVRVDRYTHGWGANEPIATENNTVRLYSVPAAGADWRLVTKNQKKYSTSCNTDTGARVEPTGFARARIDCETPGVKIMYKTINTGSAAYNASSNTANNLTGKFNTTRSAISNATTAQLQFSTDGTEYTSGNDILIGDSTYTSARKDYLSAYATKNGFENSVNGMEGIFRTVVYVHSNTPSYSINIEGGTSAGGMPNVCGFPLRDATDENDSANAARYSKNAYNYSGNGNSTPGNNFVFVSYEIISSNWAILVCRSNHAQDYPLNNYGDVVNISYIKDWNNND